MARFRFISPFKEVMCPFCYNEFHLSDMLYRDVTDDNDENKKIAAPEIAAAFGITDTALIKVIKECKPEPNPCFPLYLRIFTKTPLIRRFIVVKTNGVRFGRERKAYCGCCPRCGLRLPREWGDGDFADKTISIVGMTCSGKSCFFTELKEELENRGEEVGFDVIPLKTVSLMEKHVTVPIGYADSEEIFDKRYVEYTSKGEKIVTSPTYSPNRGSDYAQIKMPLIFRLQRKKDKKKVDLYFYDPAGEDVGKVETFLRDYHYVARSSGVLFIVDPFAFAGLRNIGAVKRFAKEDRNPIHALYNLFLDNGKLVENTITIPCAIVLSKFDLLRDEVAQLVEEPGIIHKGGYNRKYYDKLHREINKFLADRKVSLTENTIGNILDKFRLFAVSALGGTPVPFTDEKGIEKQKYPENPKPFGVVAPLFWLLYEFGFLPESEN